MVRSVSAVGSEEWGGGGGRGAHGATGRGLTDGSSGIYYYMFG